MKHPHYPSIRQRLSLRVFSAWRHAQTRLHDLSYLFWECTLRCNVNCLHCGSDCRTDGNAKDMPAADFLNVTADIAKHYNPHKVMVVITGGEPLMRKDLAETGMALYKQGYPWGMVTNGYALTPERFKELLSSGLRSITVSLDGLEESHNWLRQNKNSFAKAVEAIKIIGKAEGIVYDVVTCVNARNFNELHEIRQLLQSLGVFRWRLFSISPIGRAKTDTDLQITDAQFRALMDFIKTTRDTGKVWASYGCEGFLGDYEGKVRDGYYFCRAGINIGSVLNDGSISACPNNSRHVIQGNIYTNNFIDVWHNKFDIMRNRAWAETGLCKNCDMFKWCNGNGLHLRDFDNNTVMRCHYKMLNPNS